MDGSTSFKKAAAVLKAVSLDRKFGFSTLMIDTQKGQIQAGDTEIRVQISCPEFQQQTLELNQENLLALDSGMFISVLEKTEDNVQMSRTPDSLILKEGRATYQLKVKTTKEVLVPINVPLAKVKVSASSLRSVIKNALEATKWAAYQFKNILIFTEDDKLASVGTDGDQLLLSEARISDSIKLCMLLSPRVATVLLGIPGENFLISSDERTFYFIGEGVTVAAQRYKAFFPDYKKALPSTYKYTYVVDGKAAHKALDRLEPMIIKGEPVIISINDRDDSITFSSVVGDAHDSVSLRTNPDDWLETEVVPVKFQVDYAKLLNFFKLTNGLVKIMLPETIDRITFKNDNLTFLIGKWAARSKNV